MMRNSVQLGLLASLLGVVGACTQTGSKSESILNQDRNSAVDLSIAGKWSATRIQGFSELHNGFVKVDQSGDALDHKVLDLMITLDASGKGLIEGQSRCSDLQTRINARTSLLTRPIISEVGLIPGASLVSLTKDVSACETRDESTAYVTSKQKVIPGKLADGRPMTSFRPNKGILGAGWGSFRADSECRKLINGRFVQLLNTESTGATDGCIGFLDADKKSLRMILLPYAQSFVIQADFEAAPAEL